MSGKKSRNILISLGIAAAWVAIVFAFFYGNDRGLGNGFGVSIMYILTRNVMIWCGAVVLLIRIFGVLKDNENIFYVLTGILNLCIGGLCIILYFLNQAELQWLNKCLLNSLVGFLILADTLFFPNKSDRVHQV